MEVDHLYPTLLSEGRPTISRLVKAARKAGFGDVSTTPLARALRLTAELDLVADRLRTGSLLLSPALDAEHAALLDSPAGQSIATSPLALSLARRALEDLESVKAELRAKDEELRLLAERLVSL